MIVVYTALFGAESLDTVMPPTSVDRSALYLAFTDLPQSRIPAPYVAMESRAPQSSWHPRLKARWHKLNPSMLLNEIRLHEEKPSQAIWHDASFQLTDTPDNIMKHLPKDKWIALCPHRDRKSYAAEAAECARLRLADPKLLLDQVVKYSSWGVFTGALWETGFLIQKLGFLGLESMWWNEVYTQTIRDQVAFPSVAHRSPSLVHTLPWTVNKLPFATYRSHNRKGKPRT